MVNFELPYVAEAYVHRIGRTARAGRSGIAVSLCAPEEKGLLRDIERLTRQDLGGGGGSERGPGRSGPARQPRQGQNRSHAKPAGQPNRSHGQPRAGGDFRKLAAHMAGTSAGSGESRGGSGRPHRGGRNGPKGGGRTAQA